MSWTVRDICRLCDHHELETVLELAPTPPANELVRPEDPPQDLIPLYLARCRDCGHVQLPVVVDPARLFSNYVYVSGTAPSFREHFDRLAESCSAGLPEKGFVVEIGSNDGTLLRAFQRRGFTVQGVDPAEKIAAAARAAGVPTSCAFFTRELAQEIRRERGQADLIVANNVFAHADDLRSIALGVRDLLKPKGRFIFEVQYLVDLVDKTLFDMVYHEHLSYHSLAPLVRFFDSVGMTLEDAEHIDTHGGSIRCTVVPERGAHHTDRLRAGLLREAQTLALSVDPWGALRRRIGEAGQKLGTFLAQQKLLEREVAGYGAPAKLTTLCHEFEITAADIAYVVDDSPWKQGLLAPGTRIPIVRPYARDHAPDAFVIFAWNFAQPIAKRLRDEGFKGTIVTPLPTFKEFS